MQNDQLYSEAIRAAVLGSKEILEVYHGDMDFGVEIKADDSPLTIADQRANKVIAEVLSKTGIPILSEEGADIPFEERSNWSRFWLVDPLDGTKEFIKRNGEFTVNIALIEGVYPVFGVIHVPVSGVLYVGGTELGGSYKTVLDSAEGVELNKIVVDSNRIPESRAQNPDLSNTTGNDPDSGLRAQGSIKVVGSRSHMSPETEEFVSDLSKDGREVEMVPMGSSLKICLVAEGAADYYPRFAPTMEWDTGAGQAIAEAAGKTFTDWTTKERKRYNNEILRNNWFLVN
jgi:3'(2'), 5'-bisphosphate nucleotidase